MSCADSIIKLLADAHFSCYFSKVLPSALDCPEPIMALDGEFKRDSRMAEEERGRDLRLPMSDDKPSAAQEGRITVDAYSLASQRRAIAYGRAKGRS